MKLKPFFSSLLFVGVLVLSAVSALGQVSTFQQYYDYDGSEQAESVCQTADGGFVMTGWQFITIGVSKIFITKTDSLGNEEWHKIYGYPYTSEAYVVKQTEDGGYLVGGYTTGDQPSVLESDAYLLRLDAAGDTLWTKRYGGEGADFISDLKLTSDGGLIAAGGTTDEINGTVDGYLLKVDDAGNVEWEQNYGGNDNDSDILSSVEILGDTGYVFCGTYQFGLDTSAQVWLLRTDLDGAIIWSRTYGSPLYDFGQDVELTGDGGYLVAGATAEYDPDLNYDTYLIRTDAQGDTLWTHVLIDLDRGSNIPAVKKLSGGGFILGVKNNSTDATADGIVELRKIANDGLIQWRRFYSASLDLETIRDVIQTMDGGIAFVGASTPNEFCNSGCAWLVKTNSEGELVSLSKPEKEQLNFDIYPNPTNGLLKLDFPQRTINQFQLRIYDVLGKIVAMDEITVFSDHIIDLRDFNSGTYFIQLIDNKGIQLTQQIVLQRG